MFNKTRFIAKNNDFLSFKKESHQVTVHKPAG